MKTSVLALLLLAISCEFMVGTNAAAVDTYLIACPSEVSKGCPVPQGLYPVYFAHPEDCSMFCECGVEGIAWEVQCMSGLFWNDDVKACDWPSNVDCGERPTPASIISKEEVKQ